MTKKMWVIILSLVAMSILASYAHRFFVANNKLVSKIPVIEEGVIPAIAIHSRE
jgi:hypothetical protein